MNKTRVVKIFYAGEIFGTFCDGDFVSLLRDVLGTNNEVYLTSKGRIISFPKKNLIFKSSSGQIFTRSQTKNGDHTHIYIFFFVDNFLPFALPLPLTLRFVDNVFGRLENFILVKMVFFCPFLFSNTTLYRTVGRSSVTFPNRRVKIVSGFLPVGLFTLQSIDFQSNTTDDREKEKGDIYIYIFSHHWQISGFYF